MPAFKPHGVEVARVPMNELSSDPLIRSYRTWRAWCGDRSAPEWRDVDLMALPPPVLPLMSVVDVLDGGRDYRYRYWGSRLTELFGRDETGSLLSDHVVVESGELRTGQFDTVVNEVGPALFVTKFLKFKGIAAEKVNLRLPVCDMPGEVTKILTICAVSPNILRRGYNLAEYLDGNWAGEIRSF